MLFFERFPKFLRSLHIWPRKAWRWSESWTPLIPDSPGFSSSVEQVSKEEKIHLERVNSIPFSLFLPSAAIRYGDKASVDHAWRETTLLRHFHAYVSRVETSIRIEGRGSIFPIPFIYLILYFFSFKCHLARLENSLEI